VGSYTSDEVKVEPRDVRVQSMAKGLAGALLYQYNSVNDPTTHPKHIPLRAFIFHFPSEAVYMNQRHRYILLRRIGFLERLILQ
jgi:hypothetical protein